MDWESSEWLRTRALPPLPHGPQLRGLCTGRWGAPAAAAPTGDADASADEGAAGEYEVVCSVDAAGVLRWHVLWPWAGVPQGVPLTTVCRSRLGEAALVPPPAGPIDAAGLDELLRLRLTPAPSAAGGAPAVVDADADAVTLDVPRASSFALLHWCTWHHARDPRHAFSPFAPDEYDGRHFPPGGSARSTFSFG